MTRLARLAAAYPAAIGALASHHSGFVREAAVRELETVTFFVSWDRARYRWNPPVTIATVGNIDLEGPRGGLSLAFDRASHRFGLAYMVPHNELRISFSEDGAAWRFVAVEPASDRGTGMPSLALDRGQVYLLWRER